MIPELGHFALALACALAFAQAVLPIWGAHRADARLMAAAPALAVGQLLALGCAAAALVWASVADDFTVLNVAENSHTLKPLLYKVTGTWGNHEGSILLWALILALCGGAVAAFGRGLPSALRARVIGVLGGSSAGFLLFCLLASNPFNRMWPPPLDGRDMNPLLQDAGLAFHPPILYAGYVGFAVPFAFAVAALLEGRIDAAWGRWVRPWTLASWCLLTGGIALGSWWAYYELGWGGFWFWDPVENASLLPWLTGTALLHSAIVVEKREALKVWTVLLAIGTFSLSLAGTFLVRSGILNSVHAFANDPTRGVFILGLLAIVIGGSLLLFAFRAPVLAPGGLFAPLSREGALVLNNILLCSIAAVVITGTMYPLVADFVFGAKISVGAPFFNATVLPLAAPIFAAMVVAPGLAWKRARLGPALIRLWWAALAALAVGLTAALGPAQAFPALAFGAAAWMILGAFAEIVERIRLFRTGLGNSLSRLAGLRLSVWGTTLGHAGMGVLVAGVAGMSLATQNVVLLQPGQSVEAAGYRWTLVGLRDRPGPNYAERVATLRVAPLGAASAASSFVMEPSRRTFPVQRMTTTEAAIETNGLADIYAVLGEERDGAALMRLHYNPLAPWIWIGALIMAAGGGLSLLDRRARVGAPAKARARAPDAGSAVA
ncbi:MAG: heme lyase CcmF/NrfE family subunit [Janthinobacterium lividum]